MGFSRQEDWSGLPFPPPGYLPNPGIEPRSPALRADSLPSELLGKPCSRKSEINAELFLCKVSTVWIGKITWKCAVQLSVKCKKSWSFWSSNRPSGSGNAAPSCEIQVRKWKRKERTGPGAHCEPRCRPNAVLPLWLESPLLPSVCTVASVHSRVCYGALRATPRPPAPDPRGRLCLLDKVLKATMGYGVKGVQGKSMYLPWCLWTRRRRVKNMQIVNGWKPMNLFPVPLFSRKMGLFYLSSVLAGIRLILEGNEVIPSMLLIECWYFVFTQHQVVKASKRHHALI